MSSDDHSHDHAGHTHSPERRGHAHGPVSNRRLGIAAAVNVGFAVIQVLVGLALGSVVVLADALHQVVDAVGLLTALVALVLLRRPVTTAMSYGWGKADALGGYTSGLLLMASIAWVVYESIQRLFDPVEVDGGGVVLIGLAGIVVNGASVLILGDGEHLSLKAARLHLLVDLAGSFIVVLAGVLLSGTGYRWIDPIASLVINALVLHGTWNLLRVAGAELLDRSPVGTDTQQIGDVIRSVENVNGVHHVHTRSIAPGVSSVTAHVEVDGSVSVHDAQEAMAIVQTELATHLGIAHSTIQVECHGCEDLKH
ncbi:MAG: cation diffusion facilitator family transporter [Acidimicrobiales bacterium]